MLVVLDEILFSKKSTLWYALPVSYTFPRSLVMSCPSLNPCFPTSLSLGRSVSQSDSQSEIGMLSAEGLNDPWSCYECHLPMACQSTILKHDSQTSYVRYIVVACELHVVLLPQNKCTTCSLVTTEQMHYSIITPPDLLRVRAATFALLTTTNLEGRQTIQPESTGFFLNQSSQHATHSQQARSAMFLQQDSKVIHSTVVPLRAPFLSPCFEPVLPCVKVVLPYQSLMIPHSTYRHARCLDCKQSIVCGPYSRELGWLSEAIRSIFTQRRQSWAHR